MDRLLPSRTVRCRYRRRSESRAQLPFETCHAISARTPGWGQPERRQSQAPAQPTHPMCVTANGTGGQSRYVHDSCSRSSIDPTTAPNRAEAQLRTATKTRPNDRRPPDRARNSGAGPLPCRTYIAIDRGRIGWFVSQARIRPCRCDPLNKPTLDCLFPCPSSRRFQREPPVSAASMHGSNPLFHRFIGGVPS